LLATGDGSSSDPRDDSLGGTIRIWNRQGQGDQIRLIDSRERVVYSINWSPDGEKLLNASFWPTVAQIWNVDGTGPVVLKGHTNAVVLADWSPDGHQVATASWDGTIRLWGLTELLVPSLMGMTALC
jgi:WD40 repeat protein